MHSIKSNARREAWKYYDGDSRNYNPFARSSRGTIPVKGDEENLRHVVTADSAPSQAEQERRMQTDREYRHPDRAGTAPTHPIPNGHHHDLKHEQGTAPHQDINSVSTPPSSGRDVVDDSARSKDESRDLKPVDTSSGESGRHNEKPTLRQRLHLGGKRETPDSSSGKSVKQSKWKKRNSTPWQEMKAVAFGSWINILLILVPVSFVLDYTHQNGIAIFCVAFIAIVPLAALLSFATEELAMFVGPTLGGLLNATFGNATELIVSVIALAQGKVLIVQTSLIGSILSNLLLVLGMAFFLGGVNREKQHFNVTVAQTASSLLALSIGSLIIPTAFVRFGTDTDGEAAQAGRAPISRGTSIILLVVYGSYLFFQLKTHTTLYNAPSKKSAKYKTSKKDKGETMLGIARMGAGSAASAGGHVNQSNLVQEEEDEEEQPTLSLWGALITLGIATVLIAFCSEFMVSGIDAISGSISQEFIGLILIPIVGNAAEHATAVTVAIKDKMDLSIGVAVGSSMQIALLVIPLMVVIGWCGLGAPELLTLDFDGFQVTALFIAVLLVNYLIQDGESHWLEGVLLMATYIIIALSAFYYPVEGEVAG